MRRRLPWVCVVGAVSLLLACGGKGGVDAGTGGGAGGGFVGGAGGGGGSTGGSVSLDQFCQGYAQDYCDALIRCGQMDPNFRQGCYTFLERYQCASLKSSVTRGGSTFDAQKAATCLQAYGAALATSCNTSPSVSDPSCQDLVKPAAGPGQICTAQSDCSDQNTACSGQGCNTTCQPWGGLNQVCRYGSCSQGFWCDSASDTCKAPQQIGSNCSSGSTQNPQCVDTAYCDTTQGKCVALPGQGGTCRPGTPTCATNLYCSSNNTCQPFLALDAGCNGSDPSCGPTRYCPFVNGGYHCAPRHDVNGTCASYRECLTTLRCTTTGSTAGTCQPKGGEGASCQGTFGECEDTLYCDPVPKQCLKFSYADAGSPCTGIAVYCNDSVCVGAKQSTDGGAGTFGTCTVKGPGLPCTSLYDCGNATYCGDAGTCVASTIGSPCLGYAGNCANDAYCAATDGGSQGACVPKGGMGAACPSSFSETCLDPYICFTTNFDAGTGVCGTPSPAGAPCDPRGNYQCLVPDECVNGVCTAVGLSGQRCAQSGYCYDGACGGRNPDAGVAGVCGAYLPLGSACSTPYECQSIACDPNTNACIAACQ
ncbi:MAG: hypothetical protein ACJ790_08305 [Myxococcaceae bacterium]